MNCLKLHAPKIILIQNKADLPQVETFDAGCPYYLLFMYPKKRIFRMFMTRLRKKLNNLMATVDVPFY